MALLGLAVGPSASAGPQAPHAVEAAAQNPTEYKLKAAFLFNFIRYTTWPKGTFKRKDEPITLLIVGKDPFGALLDKTFEGKKVQGRSVVIRRVAELPRTLDAHLVYCCGLAAKTRSELLTRTSKQAVLVVGEVDGFAQAGACINMFLERQKVRFEINTGVAKRKGLSISSELLKLARIVKTEGK
ncbi:MAG: YfiR family protein [Planctomycetota bacterium]